MTADAKHTLGGVLMWGGVAAAAAVIATELLWDGAPVLLNAVPPAFLAAAIYGGVVKKRNCPRCRAGACEIPQRET